MQYIPPPDVVASEISQWAKSEAFLFPSKSADSDAAVRGPHELSWMAIMNIIKP